MTSGQLDVAYEDLSADRDALVDALVETQDRLSALVALMRIPLETLDLDAMTERMLSEALLLTRSDAVVLSCSMGRPNQRSVSAPAANGLNPILDERLDAGPRGSGTAGSTPWAAVPFPGYPDHGLAAARLTGEPYSTGDIQMLDVVALAVEYLSRMARLHAEVLRQATMESEHQLASGLAQSVMPATVPQHPGLDLFARCIPASLTGGDFMVFARVADVLWFAAGDVAGKGLPAALIMNQAVSAVRVAMRTSDPDDPAAAVAVAGAELAEYLAAAGSFVTLAVGTQRAGSGELRICNAGHSPIAFRPGPGLATRYLPPSVPPLGVQVPRPPQTLVVALPPGAALVIGTDGMVEQPGPDGQMLGYAAFIESCGGTGRSARELGEALLDQVDAHAAGVPAADDRTLMVLVAQDDPDRIPDRADDDEPVVVLSTDAPPDPGVEQRESTRMGVMADELELPADLAEMAAIGPWLQDFLARIGSDEDALSALELAVHEICVNVVTHAYEREQETRADVPDAPPAPSAPAAGAEPEQPAGAEPEQPAGAVPGAAAGERLLLSAVADADSLEITVRDHGRPFELDDAVEPTPGVPQVHGYGLMIVRKLVDELLYHREEDVNTWTLRKHR